MALKIQERFSIPTRRLNTLMPALFADQSRSSYPLIHPWCAPRVAPVYIVSTGFSVTTRCSWLNNRKQLTYAYLVTLLGVLLVTITTAYTTIRSMLFAQRRFRPNFSSGNFTANNQFGNFTGARPFGNVNPYGGVINSLTILAVIIAIIGVIWLGICLKKAQAAKPTESHTRHVERHKQDQPDG